MSELRDIPQIAFVEAVSSAGPYVAGDILSLAFVDPSLGRVRRHTPADGPDDAWAEPALAPVPEALGAVIRRAAPPFEPDECVVLSFVDPAIVRVYRRFGGDLSDARGAEAGGAPAPGTARAQTSDRTPLAESSGTGSGIVRLSGRWSANRARGFVDVAERLLAIDRLGWYRHAFAMRMLLAERLTMADCSDARDAEERFAALRAATSATLGEPLFAALLPAFTVTPEWLGWLGDARTARAISDVVAAIAVSADADAPGRAGAALVQAAPDDDAEVVTGTIARRDADALRGRSIGAVLPLFVPTCNRDATLSSKLSGYRSALVDVFDRTAHAADPVRLRRSMEPNPLLDERLRDVVDALRARAARDAA